MFGDNYICWPSDWREKAGGKRELSYDELKEKVCELERKLKQKERSPHGKERHYC